MKYEDCAINETLRLPRPPPGASQWQSCCRDTTLLAGGRQNGEYAILIPKGILVRYHIYATQRAQCYMVMMQTTIQQNDGFEGDKKDKLIVSFF